MLTPIDHHVFEQAIASTDDEKLDIIASRALGQKVTVSGKLVTLLDGQDSSPFAGGVYEVSGSALAATGQERYWNVVVKVLRSPQGVVMPDGTRITREMAEAQDSFGYWLREALVTPSGVLGTLPAGLRVPRCLGITMVSEGERWLWQEYIPADRVWDWEDYHVAAYRLGLWQGSSSGLTYDRPWFSRNWLAGWVHGPLTSIFDLIGSMEGWRHPLLMAHFVPGDLDALAQLWAGRQRTLDELASRPQALSHLDAHRANLAWQGDDLVLLDWAFVGLAAIGEELASFVGATLLLDLAPLDEAQTLESVAFAGYLSGLREAGWKGDEASLWDVYRATMALRYAPIAMASILRTAVQPSYAAEWEHRAGKPLAEILAHRAVFVRFLLSRQRAQSSHQASSASRVSVSAKATASA